MKDKVMLYKNKFVMVKECPRNSFDVLQQDAKRIMGLEPACIDGHCIGTSETHPKATHSDFYLDPPQEGSDTWNYAQRILHITWPAVLIWWENVPLVVGLDELTTE